LDGLYKFQNLNKLIDIFTKQLFYLLVDYTVEIKKTSNEHDLIFDELKTIIMDHQSVMK